MRRLLSGFNDVATLSPAAAALWDYEANASAPEDTLYRTKRRYYFSCDLGHRFARVLSGVVDGCPLCRKSYGREKLTTAEDMREVKASWSPKNSFPLADLSPQSGRRALWVCEEGHEWHQRVCDFVNTVRRSGGVRCHLCTGVTLQRGVNDFASCEKSRLVMWDRERNTEKPEDVFHLSAAPVWWLCERGHSTRRAPKKMVETDFACWRCKKKAGTSSYEQELLALLLTVLPASAVLQNDRRLLRPLELDFYIPSLKLAVEFNGTYWHDKAAWLRDVQAGTTTTKEARKTALCEEAGVLLLHVWEDDWLADPKKESQRILTAVRSLSAGASVRKLLDH